MASISGVEAKDAMQDLLTMSSSKLLDQIEHPDYDEQHKKDKAAAPPPYLRLAVQLFKQQSTTTSASTTIGSTNNNNDNAANSEAPVAVLISNFNKFIEREILKYLKPWPFIETQGSTLVITSKEQLRDEYASSSAKQMFIEKTFPIVTTPLKTNIVLLGSDNAGKLELMSSFDTNKEYEHGYCRDQWTRQVNSSMYFDNMLHQFNITKVADVMDNDSTSMFYCLCGVFVEC